MSAISLSARETSTWVASWTRRLAVPLLIFGLVFFGYSLSYGEPPGFLNDSLLNDVRQPFQAIFPGNADRYIFPGNPGWYKHHVFLTEAILNGGLDVGEAGIPDFYQDTITVEGNKYVPFSPGPSFLLLPFVALWGTGLSQVYVSIAFGAINVVLFWYLLGQLNVSRTTKLLLVPFFAFGTVHFYSATTGTVWFFAHISAVFFLLLAIIFLLRGGSLVVPGILLGMAFLSRETVILAAPFFLYWIVRQRHETVFSKEALLDRRSLIQIGHFGAGLAVLVGVFVWYNVARFGDPFETGFGIVGDGYVRSGIRYSFYRDWFPDGPHFNQLIPGVLSVLQFDFRNVPLHLYTIFVMPPDLTHDISVFRPSPYGMSVLLTSPPFVFAAFVKRKDVLKNASWLAIGLISIPLFLHLAQGWVQFGYRFLLDFAPFLLILTAFGFEDHRSPTTTKLMIFLVAFSIVANIWGRYWGTQLGW